MKIELNDLLNKMIYGKIALNRLCKIKKYLPIKEKINFIKEYNALVESHLDDFDNVQALVGFVFFHLLIVKYYTNINIDLSYDVFDVLQENNILSQIIGEINDDVTLLMNLLK